MRTALVVANTVVEARLAIANLMNKTPELAPEIWAYAAAHIPQRVFGYSGEMPVYVVRGTRMAPFLYTYIKNRFDNIKVIDK